MISVIIPLYNKELIIAKSLQSVLSQDYDDFEVVIVNDGSTDRSAEIVRSIADSRIILVEQKNGGPSKARNTGIKHAHGEWIYFIDADDEMMPNTLNHFASLIKTYPQTDMFLGEVFYNNGKEITQSNQYIEGFIDNIYKKLFYREINPCSGTLLYRKSICDLHPYKEYLRRYEDLECLLNKFRTTRIYATHFATAIINTEYAAASKGRKDVKEDFVGHLDFKRKSFWEKMCLFQFYLGERDYYLRQIDQLYPTLKYRFDLLLLYKLLK